MSAGHAASCQQRVHCDGQFRAPGTRQVKVVQRQRQHPQPVLRQQVPGKIGTKSAFARPLTTVDGDQQGLICLCAERSEGSSQWIKPALRLAQIGRSQALLSQERLLPAGYPANRLLIIHIGASRIGSLLKMLC